MDMPKIRKKTQLMQSSGLDIRLQKNLMRTMVVAVLVKLKFGGFWITNLSCVFRCCSQNRTSSWQDKKGFHLHLTACEV